jgi:phosphopantetheinyl transferase (holo-ACP synthase)
MLTKEAIVKVNNRPVANLYDYMKVLNLTYKTLDKLWEDYTKDTQRIIGKDFNVSLTKTRKKVMVWEAPIYNYKLTVKKV